jgi:hypothetical protein
MGRDIELTGLIGAIEKAMQASCLRERKDLGYFMILATPGVDQVDRREVTIN